MGIAVIAGFERNRLHNDSAQYKSTARNIRDRNEVKTSIVFFGEQIESGEVPAPQTVFPAGFPAIVASVSSSTGFDLRTSGFAVNLICYLATGYLIYDLCLKLGGSRIAGIASAATWLCLGIAVHCTQWGLSEPSFMLCQVLALRLLVSRRLPWVAFAGCCAALAITVRYAGIFLVLAAGISYFVILVSRRDWRTAVEAITFAVPPTLMVFILFRRSMEIVGTPLGGNNYPTQPIAPSVLLFVSNGMKLFGIDRSIAVTGRYSNLVTIAAVVTLVVVCSRFLADRHRRSQLGSLLLGDPPVRLLVILYPVAYLAILLAVQIKKGSGVSDRLLLPFVPICGLAIAVIASQITQPVRSQLLIRTVFTGALILFLVGQYNAYLFHLHSKEYPGGAIARAVDAQLNSGMTLRSFLRENVSDNHPLLCNQPQLTHAILDVPVVGLATHRYNTGGRWTAARVEKDIIDRFGIGHVLRFRTREFTNQHTPQFFWEIDVKMANRLNCIFENSEVKLYEVLPVPSHPRVQQ